MTRRVWIVVAVAAAAAALAWALLVAVPRWSVPAPAPAPAAIPAAAEAAARAIKATLYYVTEDGLNLVGVERDVPYAEATVDQARHLVEAQLAPAPAPLIQAVPEGTVLQALFVTEQGQAFVDLSPEVATRHTGGSLDELFTVYAIVNTLTVNLPAIKSVQILLDGREVETLVGHVDLRSPLVKNLSLLPKPPAAAPAPPAAPAPAPPPTPRP